MKKTTFLRSVLVCFALTFFYGCESTGGGGSTSAVYYGVGFYDPWYYGDHYHDDDIVITPPGGIGDGERGPRPAHPIANPPSISARPTAMPSIPSAPRVAPRGGRR